MTVTDRPAEQPVEGPVCTVAGLRVRLTGTATDVVEGFDLAISPGEIVGLVGESGSGKTTAGTALLGYARRYKTLLIATLTTRSAQLCRSRPRCRTSSAARCRWASA